MNQRFSQIIAESIDPKTGRVDRARLFNALQTDPRDPTAPLFEAAAFTFETIQEFRQTLPAELTAKFRELLVEFAALQSANADQAKAASQTITSVCAQLERWARAFTSLNQRAVEREITSISETATKALDQAATASRNIQQSVQTALEQMQSQQDAQLKVWEKVRQEAVETAKALDHRAAFALFVIVAIALALGIGIGMQLSR